MAWCPRDDAGTTRFRQSSRKKVTFASVVLRNSTETWPVASRYLPVPPVIAPGWVPVRLPLVRVCSSWVAICPSGRSNVIAH